MNNQKLQEAIESYQKKKHLNPERYEDVLRERKNRSEKYRSFDKERLLAMDETALYEYIGDLWAMLLWGNKQYVVDKIIADNGFEDVKKHLVDLLYGADSLETRWDNFQQSVKGIGPATMSELLSYIDPENCVILNRTTVQSFEYLGVEGIPHYHYQNTGRKYIEICDIAKDVSAALKDAGIKDADLLTVDYFLWDEVLPMASKSQVVLQDVKDDDNTDAGGKEKSLHEEIKERLVEIGTLLGFSSSTEVKVATGAVVDVIWEATIGNMGKVIYVFEVQSKGSIDSLILNLKKAQSNAAVQAVVAVADEAQLEKIQSESINVIAEKDLRVWDVDDVLAVHEALSHAHESINKLALVPKSFGV